LKISARRAPTKLEADVETCSAQSSPWIPRARFQITGLY
jgi:hypothetical protein